MGKFISFVIFIVSLPFYSWSLNECKAVFYPNEKISKSRSLSLQLGIASTLNRTTDFYVQQSAFIRSTKGYQKLKGLYQFAMNYEDNTLTNRWAHSEKVASVAREFARSLGLSSESQELAATIGLAHDIGHPVFSHWGEVSLRERLVKHGLDWNHDTAGVQAVTEWTANPQFLSIETIEGLAKRFWRFDPTLPRNVFNHPTSEIPLSIQARADFAQMHLSQWNHLEGQIASQADRISFYATDIQDGLRVGRISLEELKTQLPTAHRIYEELLQEIASALALQAGVFVSPEGLKEQIEMDYALRDFVLLQFSEKYQNFILHDFLLTTRGNLSELKSQTSAAVQANHKLVVACSDRLHQEFMRFEDYARKNIYPRTTAHFKPLIDAVIDLMFKGKIRLPEPYRQNFEALSDEGARWKVIAKYLTLEASDEQILNLALENAPEVYLKYFPGYESVRTHDRIKTQLDFNKRLSFLLTHKSSPLLETKPTQQEIVDYATEFLRTRQTTDPRNPNKIGVLPSVARYVESYNALSNHRTYGRERSQLHEQIVNEALFGKKASLQKGSRRPYFLVVSGGMSVGMTYFQRLLVEENLVEPQNTVIITPLTFQLLPEFANRTYYQHTEKSGLLVDEYYDISAKIIAKSIQLGLNVMYVDQADQSAALRAMASLAQHAHYETALVGLTMTPEAYFAASELWLTNFNRIPDHQRGFGDLREFSQAYAQYKFNFDYTALFETYFHVEDIGKQEGDVTRKEYTVRQIAYTWRKPTNAMEGRVIIPERYIDFVNRGRFLNHEALSLQEARKNYPASLGATQINSQHQGSGAYEIVPASDTPLGHRLQNFSSGDFEKKFVDLVRRTSARRSQQSKSR